MKLQNSLPYCSTCGINKYSLPLRNYLVVGNFLTQKITTLANLASVLSANAHGCLSLLSAISKISIHLWQSGLSISLS